MTPGHAPTHSTQTRNDPSHPHSLSLPSLPQLPEQTAASDRRGAWEVQPSRTNSSYMASHLASDRHGGSVQVHYNSTLTHQSVVHFPLRPLFPHMVCWGPPQVCPWHMLHISGILESGGVCARARDLVCVCSHIFCPKADGPWSSFPVFLERRASKQVTTGYDKLIWRRKKQTPVH